jgi:hypothetical protein
MFVWQPKTAEQPPAGMPDRGTLEKAIDVSQRAAAG